MLHIFGLVFIIFDIGDEMEVTTDLFLIYFDMHLSVMYYQKRRNVGW